MQLIRLTKIKILFTSLSSVLISAHAENSVNLYGLLDAGYAKITNAENYKASPAVVNAGKTWSDSANGGLSSSRYGATGTYNMASGLDATATLEAAFFPTNFESGNTEAKGTNRYNGSVPNGTLLFSREATVGLSGAKYGTLKMGRSTTITYEQTGKFDPISPGPGLSNFGSIGSFKVYDLSRADNQIKYYTPNYLGFEGGLAYSTMGGIDNLNAGTTRELYLGFKSNELQLLASYLGTTTVAYNEYGLTSTNTNILSYYGAGGGASLSSSGLPGFEVVQLDAIYAGNQYKVFVGYDFRKDQSGLSATANSANSINVAYTGLRYTFNPTHQLALGYYSESDNTVAIGKGGRATMTTLQYIFTPYKNFDIYGVYSSVTNQSGTYITVGDNANIFAPSTSNTGTNPQPGDNQVGYMIGIRYQFDYLLK